MEKYDRINLDEYIQTGEGGTAVSYIHRGAGDTLVKLYNPGFEAEKARAGHPVHVQPNSIIQFLGLVV